MTNLGNDVPPHGHVLLRVARVGEDEPKLVILPFEFAHSKAVFRT